HVPGDRVPTVAGLGGPQLQLRPVAAVPVVEQRLPEPLAGLVVEGVTRVTEERGDLVGVEHGRNGRIDLAARHDPALAPLTWGFGPAVDDEDVPVAEPTADQARRVVRLRAVEERND